MRRLLLLTIVGLFATTGSASVAWAAPVRTISKISLIPAASQQSLSIDDGHRLIVLTGTSRDRTYSTSLLDLRTREPAPLDLPDWTCRPPEAGPPGHSAQLLVECDLSAGTSFVRPFTSTLWSPVTLRASFQRDSPYTVAGEAVGRHWITVQWNDFKGYETGYLSRDDGRTVADAALGSGATADLDRVDVAQPLCAPLQRSGHTVDKNGDANDSFAPFLYTEPWGVTVAAADAGAHGNSGDAIRVQRCGSRRAMTVCRGTCTGVSMQDARLAWSTGPDGFVRDLNTGRTTRVHIRGHAVQLRLVGRYVLATLDPFSSMRLTGLVKLR